MQPPLKQRLALLAGGGTGGHVYPALALARELRERGWELLYAGRAESFESRLATEAGLEFVPLAARPLVGRGRLGQLRALARLGLSARQAARLVRRRGVAVVVGTGGYVSAPAVLGGSRAGAGTLLLEPNARPGTANRWLSRFADAAITFLASGDSELRCPTLRLGVPVRPEFVEARSPLPTGATPRLLVLGGSQGAQQLNQLTPRVVERIAGTLGSLRVVHQCGAGNLESTRLVWEATSIWGEARLEVEMTAYIETMAEAIAAAHLVLTRAGALTLAELCAVGRPAVLVPLTAAHGHQLGNARVLEAAGGATVVESEEATVETLAPVLLELLDGRELLEGMAEASREMARPEAAAAIAEEMENLLEARP